MGNHVCEQVAVERTQAETAEKRGNPRKLRWRIDRAVLVSLALTWLVFVVDANTPLGVASAVPFSLAVLIALKARSTRFVYWLASLCSALTMLDLAIGPGPGGTEMWKVVTNRFLALFMIWVTTILGVRRRRAEELRRRAEEQTRLHLADLAHLGRVEIAGQLATGLAHELNQPLAAISLQAEIAGKLVAHDGSSSRQTMIDAMSQIAEQSERAAAIIRKLRELVQKTPIQRLAVDINQLVRETTQMIEPLAQRAAINIDLRLVKTPPVLGDKVQLEQVLLNLLQNAIEAADDDEDGPRLIHVHTSLEEQQVVIRVQDTGVGLLPNQVERVFERFYTTKSGGMGMGLAISRSIVEAHGGQLWAEGNSPRGATFTLTLTAISRS